ncbi:hypothetical protein ACA910_011421 [Epithemia clementina (nom. ined.)]
MRGENTVGDRRSKRRMADRLYSRQKRERQRVMFQSLQEKNADLSAEKERLLAEQVMLERLLIEAEECMEDLSQESGELWHFLSSNKCWYYSYS